MCGKTKNGEEWKYDDRLKPCPFCGAPAIMVKTPRPDVKEGYVLYSVMCGAHFTVDCFYPDTGYSETEETAIAEWNQRDSGNRRWKYVPPNQYDDMGRWELVKEGESQNV